MPLYQNTLEGSLPIVQQTVPDIANPIPPAFATNTPLATEVSGLWYIRKGISGATMTSPLYYDVTPLLWRHLSTMTSLFYYDVTSLLWRHLSTMMSHTLLLWRHLATMMSHTLLLWRHSTVTSPTPLTRLHYPLFYELVDYFSMTSLRTLVMTSLPSVMMTPCYDDVTNPAIMTSLTQLLLRRH